MRACDKRARRSETLHHRQLEQLSRVARANDTKAPIDLFHLNKHNRPLIAISAQESALRLWLFQAALQSAFGASLLADVYEKCLPGGEIRTRKCLLNRFVAGPFVSARANPLQRAPLHRHSTTCAQSLSLRLQIPAPLCIGRRRRRRIIIAIIRWPIIELGREMRRKDQRSACEQADTDALKTESKPRSAQKVSVFMLVQ